MPDSLSVNLKPKSMPIDTNTCHVDCLRVQTRYVMTKPRSKIDTFRNSNDVPIGKIREIPDSVKYSPSGHIRNAYAKYVASVYKSEINIGINKKNARKIDVCLAKYAYEVADEIGTVGACYTGFKYTFLSAGIIDDYGDMPKGSAYEALPYFESNPEKFEKVDMTGKDVKDLSAGYIVVYTKDGEDGHIAITNGYGQEMSDCTDNMEWVRNHGEGTQVHVYKLTDNWQYDENTMKLKFVKPEK